MLLNVDRVAEQLEEMGYQGIQVRGLADSGWFLDNKQYRRTDCIDTITCAPTEAIRRGIRYSQMLSSTLLKEVKMWNRCPSLCSFILIRSIYCLHLCFSNYLLGKDNKV